MIQDGFILMYVKDEEVYSVPMSDEELETLQVFIPGILGKGTIKISDKSMGKVVNLARHKT